MWTRSKRQGAFTEASDSEQGATSAKRTRRSPSEGQGTASAAPDTVQSQKEGVTDSESLDVAVRTRAGEGREEMCDRAEAASSVPAESAPISAAQAAGAAGRAPGAPAANSHGAGVFPSAMMAPLGAKCVGPSGGAPSHVHGRPCSLSRESSPSLCLLHASRPSSSAAAQSALGQPAAQSALGQPKLHSAAPPVARREAAEGGSNVVAGSGSSSTRCACLRPTNAAVHGGFGEISPGGRQDSSSSISGINEAASAREPSEPREAHVESLVAPLGGNWGDGVLSFILVSLGVMIWNNMVAAALSMARLWSNISTGPLATWGDSIVSFVLLLLVIFAWNHMFSILFFFAVYYNLAVASDHMRQVFPQPALPRCLFLPGRLPEPAPRRIPVFSLP
jgi:hypothetical protein